MYWYCEYCWYIGTSHSMSLYQYVTGTVGTLVPVTLCLCTNMLLVLHWYCSLYVLVLWVPLVHWYRRLYVSVPICYWYCTGIAVYMYWYCGYCWYIGTSHSMSLCLYITGTTLVLLFICTGTVGTVGTLVPATLFLCTNMLLVLHWHCCLYVLVLWVLLVHWYQPLYFSVQICYWYCTGTGLCMSWYCGYCWYIGTSHSMSLYQYISSTTLVLLFICTGNVGTVGTLVPATLFLCTNMLLVLYWYCSLYVLVLWVLLVHWYQPLYFSVPICYWYCTGTALYMYRYCGYCWYIGRSDSMSLCLFVTGTTLVLLLKCTGTVGTVGTLVQATLFLCTNMLLVLHWYCSLYVLVLWVLLVHWYQPLFVSVPICYWYCIGTALYMYWYCGYCWYIGMSDSMYLYKYVTGTAVVLLFICTGTVGTVGTSHSVFVPICYWYRTGTALYMYWYCGYCWYIGTSQSMSLCLYVTGTTLVLLFIRTCTVDTLVPATLSLCLCGCVSLCLLCLSACCVSVPVPVPVVSLCLCGYLVVCLCGCGFPISICTSCACPSVYVYILLLCK